MVLYWMTSWPLLTTSVRFAVSLMLEFVVCDVSPSQPANHGLPATSLTDVFRATIIVKLSYCSPAWSGLTSAQHRPRIAASWDAANVTDTVVTFRWSLTCSLELTSLCPDKYLTMNLVSFTSSYPRKLTVSTTCALDNFRKSTHINDSMLYKRRILTIYTICIFISLSQFLFSHAISLRPVNVLLARDSICLARYMLSPVRPSVRLSVCQTGVS